MTYHAKVIAGGKVVIPADIRRELGIKDGDLLVVDRDAKGSVVLRTHDQMLADVGATFEALRNQAGAGAAGVVAELLAERREEARREAADDGSATDRPA